MTGAVKINLQFMKWELLIAALLLLIAVFIARGKGIKRAVAFLAVTFFLLGISFVTKYMTYLAFDDPAKAVRLGIAWGPTVAFAIALVWSTLFGVWRGFRKSAILALHAVCAAAVCLGLFFFFTRSAAFDRWLLKAINAILGDGGLQAKLNVSADCASLRQVLAEWIPARMNYGTEVSIILRENGAYLDTLVDMAFRVAFAYVSYLLYLFLVFVLYIVYHIAYSERKYKRRVQQKVRDNRIDKQYRPHRVAGGIVGLVRGVAGGILSLSMLGALFFMAADIGRNKAADLSFGNKNRDFAYSVYTAVEDYGEHGIFRFLNGMRGDDGSPYYLFAADLIFSGRLRDDTINVNANVKFRKEIGAYVQFARQTTDLLLRYGGDDVRAAIEGKAGVSKKDAVLQVLKMPQFQWEFENLIDRFESQTYIVNFALSAANSLIGHIGDTRFASSLNEKTRGMLQVMFTPGYLSDKIPEERAMIESGETEGEQPYIGLPLLFQRSDAKVLYRMVSAALTAERGGTDATLAIARELITQSQGLSVFATDRAALLDPVYGRLYCYLANTYLAGDDGEEITYRQVTKANVDWTRELQTLISVSEDGFALTETVRAGEGNALDKVLSVFDEQSPSYAENMAAYDRLAEKITRSKLIGQVLSTRYISDKLRTAFSSVSENMYLPRSVVYENTASGKGELHQLLYGIRLLGRRDNRELLEKITADETDAGAREIFDLLGQATAGKDEYGSSLADYMVNSVYLRSLMSSVLLEKGGDSLYVPETALEREGNAVIPLVQKNALAQLFEAFADEEARTLVLDFIESDDADVSAFIAHPALARVLDMGNAIIEGTVSRQLAGELEQNDKVTVPYALRLRENGLPPDGWLTVRGNAGELRKLVAAMRLPGVDVNAILDEGKIEKSMLKEILAGSENAAEVLFASFVLHATVSDAALTGKLRLRSGIDLIVPAYVTETLADGSTLIRYSEMIALCRPVSEMDIAAGATAKEILRTFTENGDAIVKSAILSASVADYIATDETLAQKGVCVPARYRAAAQKDALMQASTSEANVRLWQKEIAALNQAIELIIDLRSEGDLTVNGEKLGALTSEELQSVYLSKTLACTVSDLLLKNDALIVPASYVDSDEILRLEEADALLGAYKLLAPDGASPENWKPAFTVPESESTRQTLLQSATVRAMLTDTVRKHNAGKSLYVQGIHAERDARVKKTEDGALVKEEADSATAINAAQLAAMFDVLLALGGDVSEFTLPALETAADVFALRNRLPENGISLCLECDILRYRISSAVKLLADAAGVPLASEEVFDIGNGKSDSVFCYTAEDLAELLRNVPQQPSLP